MVQLLRRRMLPAGLLMLLGAAALTQLPSVARAESAPPLHLVTEEATFTYVQAGKVAGPATEILKRVMEGAGIASYDINIYPWARAYDLALTQPNVLIYLIARTPEREGRFKWVGELIRLNVHFYRLKSRPDIQVRALSEARDYKIGVAREDFRHQYLSRQGFTKLLVESRTTDNLRQLFSQRVDLVALADTDLSNLCQQEFADCAQLERVYRLEDLSTPLYAAFSMSTSDEVVERVRQNFDRLKTRGKIKL